MAKALRRDKKERFCSQPSLFRSPDGGLGEKGKEKKGKEVGGNIDDFSAPTTDRLRTILSLSRDERAKAGREKKGGREV